ncbi:hypothetical protein TanjilG_23829 [Lupinus angustifolius]|uniref:mTERF protein n=1 Tax=Lupinus angustifolius TaxID=3871 RepID=A0A4P1QV43_LUPAN|nr:PREDICTED: uncharacterized protein LOC109328990 [Lupinus angustifolius]OIV95598.1 hypothetical protein TanjilG_23829 [Lupinus angustifolius]
MMFKSHSYKPFLLHLNGIISLKFSTKTSQSHSFIVSYLINNLGFSSETALKASKRLRFNTSQKPDSVLAFFKSHGFSDSQVSSIITKTPHLLSSDPHKNFMPKFEFFASKGASSSEIVLAVTKNHSLLLSSLENNIIPMYGLIRRFFESDEKALHYFLNWPDLLQKKNHVKQNLELLFDEGVKDSNFYFIGMKACVFHSDELRKAVDEVKELGFDPSTSSFLAALAAKATVPKAKWDEKVDAFKSWGWSEETIAAAFKRHPRCMLTSKEKINAVIRFWVNQLGWNSSYLAMFPVVFGYSLEKRIIPRASVVQYLLSQGLIKKNASLYTPFVLSEEIFLEKYVKAFNAESFQLLKLYKGG